MTLILLLIFSSYLLFRIEKLSARLEKLKEYYLQETSYNDKVEKWLKEVRTKHPTIEDK